MTETYITVFLFSLIFLFGAAIEDRCTKHSHPNDWYYPYNLTECPSSEKFNLLECYDKSFENPYNIKFWCWSRRDNDEKVIKNVPISTAHVEDVDLIRNINRPFST